MAFRRRPPVQAPREADSRHASPVDLVRSGSRPLERLSPNAKGFLVRR